MATIGFIGLSLDAHTATQNGGVGVATPNVILTEISDLLITEISDFLITEQ